MKHLHVVSLAVLLALPVERASAQHVLDFTNTGGASFGQWDRTFGSPTENTVVGGSPYAGLDFAGRGNSFGNGVVTGGGDGESILMHSATPFDFLSAAFSSVRGQHQRICVAGYTLAQHAGSSFIGCDAKYYAPFYMSFDVDPGVFTIVNFDWEGVTEIAFDSHGGVDPNDPSHSTYFLYMVDDITVSTAPEPATLTLLATGMLAVLAIGRRRFMRPIALA